MITIPEIQLKAIVDAFIEQTMLDWNSKPDKTQTWLFSVFGDLELEGWNYLNNAVALLGRDGDHPRKIETHIFFNKNRFSLPTIHIVMPSEMPTSDNGVGFDWGYNDKTTQEIQANPQETIFVGSRTFQSQYNVVFTSDNTFEVLLMYHWFKAAVVGNSHILEWNGLTNVTLQGNDIMLNDSLTPGAIYSRSILVNCQTLATAPAFLKWLAPTDVVFKGEVILGEKHNEENN